MNAKKKSAPSSAAKARRARRNRAGKAGPERPGWNRNVVDYYVNPRPPAVTHTLAPELNLERYFAAGALMGLLSSQIEEPDQEWASEWSLEMGEKMARAARKRQGGK